MRRTVSTTLELEIREPAEIALQIAVTAGERVDELLDIQLDGTPIPSLEVAGAHGGRSHVLGTGQERLVATPRALRRWTSTQSQRPSSTTPGAWSMRHCSLRAPRSSLVRIATGRDAADTAFLTVLSGTVDLMGIEVGAVVEGALPGDDPRALVSLG